VEKIVLHRLARDVFNTPLMILPEKLDVILSVIGDRIGFDHMIDPDTGTDLMSRSSKNRGVVESSSRISVIPIQGSLVNRTYGLSPDSMLQTYDDIRNDFNAALDSDSEAILFDINSPGGTASGVFDLVDEIYEARGEKPIYAMANEAAYSAAFAIGSAADKIFLSRTAHVGSIGVIGKHKDESAANEKAGIKYTTVFKGARKADFSADAPLSDEAKAVLDEECGDVFDIFTKTVARNLDMPRAQVIATEAGIFMGDKAVLKGLAHEVIAAKDVQAKILAELDANPNKEEGTEMAEKKQDPKLEIKEVKIMNAQELREKHPELVAEIESSLEQKLATKFDGEKTAMATENSTLKDSVLKLEKFEAIRQVREVKTDADGIWTSALAGSDIPDRLHNKVKVQVSHEKFVEDGILDRDGFSAAVKTEVEDWETRGATSQVMGTGFSSKGVEDEEATKLQKEEADDDALAEEIFAASGGTREEVK